jgi:hypothetical protein
MRTKANTLVFAVKCALFTANAHARHESNSEISGEIPASSQSERQAFLFGRYQSDAHRNFHNTGSSTHG